MFERTMVAAALAVLMMSPALAAPKADASNGRKSDSTAFIQQQTTDQWRGSKLVGATVLDASNEKLGTIADVLINQNGRIEAVVIAVGEKNVAIQFKALNIRRVAGSDTIDTISIQYTKAQLADAPAFNYFSGLAGPTPSSAGAIGPVTTPPPSDKTR